jgi:ribosome-associated protein
MRALAVNSQIVLPASELRLRSVRSSGPGGQRVNKVSTKAVLTWDFARSTSLPDDVRTRFEKRFLNHITAAGQVIVTSQRYRDLGRNTEDCIDKLRQMILRVAREPIRRRPTRPTFGSKEARLRHKRIQALKKDRRRIAEY